MIWVFVWLIARSVTEEDLKEYQLEKAHRARFDKYILQRQEKDVREARRAKAKRD